MIIYDRPLMCSMLLSNLPPELHNQILVNLCGISLAKAECVCKLWNKIVTAPPFNLIWRRECLTDIEESVLVQLTGVEDILVCNLKYSEKPVNKKLDCNHVWKAVYKKWYTSKKAGYWPVAETKIKTSEGGLNHIDVSGDIICTAHKDKSIRLWDSWTGQCLQTFYGHHKAVQHIVLYHNPATTLDMKRIPHLLVSGSDDAQICVWDVFTGSCEATFTQHTGPVNCLAVTNKYIISASHDSNIMAWDLSQKILCLNISRAHVNPILHLSVCKWTAVSVSQDKVKFWSLKNGECLQWVKNKDFIPSELTIGCFLRHGHALIVKNDGKLNLWNFNKSMSPEDEPFLRYNLLNFETTKGSRISCVSTYANLLALGSKAGVVFLFYFNKDWSEQLSKIHSQVNTGYFGLCCMTLHHDGDGPILVTGYNDGTVKIFRWFSPVID